jgi:uncharacterized protein
LKTLHMLTFALLAVGGLNWGLVGLFDYNLVSSLLPAGLADVVYILVGLSAVWEVFTHKQNCRQCGTSQM